MCRKTFSILLLMCLLSDGVVGQHHLQGPVFLMEPPGTLDFSNTSGAMLSCSAHGTPPPDIRWLDAADKDVQHIPRLREVLSNGSLYFPPFLPQDFNPDIHATTYRCRASNPVGSIVSRDCRLRAEVVQPYQVQVHNVFALLGNVAVLQCSVPSFVRGVVAISSWLKDEPLLSRTAIQPGGRYTTTTSGSLHIHDVRPEDTVASFYCQTIHKLTGERRLSQPGKIFLTESKGHHVPRIEHTITTVHARAGNPADLICAAQGDPPPTYRWFRSVGGSLQEVRPGSVLVRPLHSVLQFPRGAPEDSGRYVCVVANALGEDRREIALSVAAPLTAHIRPQQQVIDAGAPAAFNCSVMGGSGGVHISWLKDARPFIDNPRIGVLQGGAVLMLHSVSKSDRGMYQCVARSGEETAQGSAELTLGAIAPELQSTFIEQTLQPGPPVSLRCVASGNPPPRITWLLDGGEVLPRGYVLGSFLDSIGDVVSHLNITSVRVQHGGLYTCVARNVLGAAQYSGTLNIYGPPSARLPQNLTVVAETDVYLRCPVAGYPITSVTWQRAGEILPAHIRHRVFPNGTLYIRQVEAMPDRGEYTCAVTNQQGQSAQGKLYLDIMNPPQIAPFQFPANLRERMRAQVSCSIISGDLPISITWRKDGGPIPQEADLHEQQHEFVSILMFSDLSSRHSGHYTCIASNAAAVANYTAKLIVQVAPTWYMEPHDTSVLYQHPVALHCQATGFPIPKIIWMVSRGEQPGDYMPLESSTHLTVASNGSVLVRAADQSHEGHYLCQANNGIGSGLSKVIFLNVNVPAHFRTPSVNQSAVAGEGTVLICEAQGDLPLQVSWSASHRPLFPSHTQLMERQLTNGIAAELHLDSLMRRDEGAYRCSAANEFGQDEMVVYLSVKEPPEAPGRIEIEETGSRWVSINWGLPFSGHSPISHYIVQFKEEGSTISWNNVTVSGTMRKARISGLKPSSSYKIRLLAVNDVGAGQPSDTTVVFTQQEAPSGPPTDVTLEAISQDSVLVRWKPPHPSYSNGEILGYQVSYREISSGTASIQQVRTVRGRHRLEVTLLGLQHYTRYEVTVRAFNQVGSGPSSPPQHITTLEGVPDMPPQDLTCSSLSSQSVRVRWNPPPLEHRNGVIRGYKVFYKQVFNKHGYSSDTEVKKTTNLETNLHGMEKYANYSIRVLAFTSAGEGIRSHSIFCTTEEDVPGPPSQIKALVMTSDSIMVSWTKPTEPNGIIVKYNVYISHIQQHGNNKETHKETVYDDKELMYEVRPLKELHRYEFWVTAFTSVGEGLPSTKVSQSPISRVPARIASFSKRIINGVGHTIVLPCYAVGLPAPSRIWKEPTGNIIGNDRKNQPRVQHDGSLSVGPLLPENAGNYTCTAENVFGRDEIVYDVIVQVPPSQPILTVTGVTIHTISLQWKLSDNGGSPILGFTLSYKHELDDWKEISLDSDHKTYVLDGVKCGSNYQLFLTAVNSVGKSKPSTVISATTKGGVPRIPPQEDFLVVNSTSVTLFLDTWPNGGCPIKYFVVEHRSQDDHTWTLVSNNLLQEELVIPNLAPATWYFLRVTAHNDAGSNIHEFVFATKTRNGETIFPEMSQDPNVKSGSFYSQLNIIIPIISGIICTIAASICVCILIHRRHYMGYKQSDSSYGTKSLAELENQRNSDQQSGGQLYSPSPGRKGDSSLSGQKGSDTSGPDYEICPYATFSLPGTNNTQTMGYSMQFQTFSQQECYSGQPQATTSGYASRSNKEHYSHTRAKSNVSRTSGNLKAARSSNSPPDGLSLEISCISSQQTLPVSASNGNSHHCRNQSTPIHLKENQICFSRSRSCSVGTDRESDSSGGPTSPRRVDTKNSHYKLLPANHRSLKNLDNAESVFELDSSTESAEASPEMYHRSRRVLGVRKGAPSR